MTLTWPKVAEISKWCSRMLKMKTKLMSIQCQLTHVPVIDILVIRGIVKIAELLSLTWPVTSCSIKLGIGQQIFQGYLMPLEICKSAWSGNWTRLKLVKKTTFSPHAVYNWNYSFTLSHFIETLKVALLTLLSPKIWKSERGNNTASNMPCEKQPNKARVHFFLLLCWDSRVDRYRPPRYLNENASLAW